MPLYITGYGHDVIRTAGYLVSEEGENPEYDRGVTELVGDFIGVSSDDKIELAQLIGVKPAAIQAWGDDVTAIREA